jgi:hypothetical protein
MSNTEERDELVIAFIQAIGNGMALSVPDRNRACQAAEYLRDRLASLPPEQAALSFDDALRIASGCTDYGGGYRFDDRDMSIYQHGIQTVINALTSARERGLADTQVRALHCMGAEQAAQPSSLGAPASPSGSPLPPHV